MGRYIRKHYLDLIRSKDSIHSIALGVAIGLFIGFFIPFGLQIVIAIPAAIVFKAKKLPAVAATWVSNQFTVPILYPLLCALGAWVLGEKISPAAIRKDVSALMRDFTWERVMDFGSDFLLTFLVGGFIVGVASAVIGYLLTYGIISLHRDHISAKKLRRLHEKAASLNARRGGDS